MRRMIIAAAMALASCGSNNDRPRPIPAPPNLMSAASWTIGPVIDGKNSSKGTPLHPTATAEGFAFDIPQPPGSIHYVTAPTGPLTGKSKLVLRYRLDAAEGVAIKPSTDPAAPSLLTLYFQRCGDDWSASGKYEAFRWYGTFATQMPIAPGSFELSVPLDDQWTAVLTSTASSNPSGFAAAKANACLVGFVFGGGTGYGHGVFATGPARFTVLDFRVE